MINMKQIKIEPLLIEQLEERQEAASCKQKIDAKLDYNDGKIGGEIGYKISW